MVCNKHGADAWQRGSLTRLWQRVGVGHAGKVVALEGSHDACVLYIRALIAGVSVNACQRLLQVPVQVSRDDDVGGAHIVASRQLHNMVLKLWVHRNGQVCRDGPGCRCPDGQGEVRQCPQGVIGAYVDDREGYVDGWRYMVIL